MCVRLTIYEMKVKLEMNNLVLKPVLVDLNEYISINLSKSTAFSLQTLANNLKPP